MTRRDDQAEMSLLEHLEELRQRLLKALVALGIGTIAGTFLTPLALKALTAPLGDATPLVLSPTEGASVFFKIALVIGVALAMPVIVYQAFQFIRPGLRPNEQRYILIAAPAASLSFAVGAIFAGRVLLPTALPFLRGFTAGIAETRYSIDQYLSFVGSLLLGVGIVFETPLVMFFLAKLGVATPQKFAKARGVVLVGGAIGAAVITPTTDIVNMLLVLLPFILLYEMGILLARFA